MHLSLRYAASLPLLLAIIFALVSPVLKHAGLLSTGRAEVPMYALLIMGPVVSLLFVIPNLGAAIVANHYGQTAAVFIGLFLVTGFAIWLGEALFLNRLTQMMGGTDMLSAMTWLMVGAELIACLLVAAFVPEPAVG